MAGTCPKLAISGLLVAQLLSMAGALGADQVVRTEEVRSQQATAAVGTSVTAAVRDWETTTNVVVSPGAKGIIFEELSGSSTMGIPEAAIPFVARAYLYEMRDRKAAASGGSGTLSVADFRGYSLSMFATQVALEKKVGYLKCLSQPEGADITIDGKARGRTVKEFVVSVGSHLVGIRAGLEQCEEKIQIEEGQSHEIRCPQR